MIENDEQAKNVIIENIEMYNKSEDAKKLLTIILRLCEKYSFKKQIKAVKDRLENSLSRDYLTYQIAHTMILLQGKHICKSKCKCENCFITDCWNFYKEKNKVDDKDKKYDQLELTDFIDECR